MLLAQYWPASGPFPPPWDLIITILMAVGMALGLGVLAILAGLIISRKPGHNLFGKKIEETPQK